VEARHDQKGGLMAYLLKQYEFAAPSLRDSDGSEVSDVFEPTGRPSWWRQAACLGVGNEVFYPEGRGIHYTEARLICQACPVQAECLLKTLTEEGFQVARALRHGFAGGLMPKERTTFGRWLSDGLGIEQRPGRKHGTLASYQNGCKCASCMCANAEHVRRWRNNTPTKGKRGTVASSARHGTRSRYVAGCRCADCLRADRDYHAGRYAKRNARRRAS
jgi:hypothetical protein